MSPKQPPNAQKTLIDLFAQAQQQHNLFPSPPEQSPAGQDQPIVVAVSGGVDSIALLHLLVQSKASWQLTLHVAHVDHALRPASAEDAAFVRHLAEQLALPFHTTRLDAAALRAAPDGLEAAARHARYRFLYAIALNVTPATMVPIIAVAHHADDQAETVLLRLTQGSGLRGLGAMRAATTIDDPALVSRPVRVVRPLLAATRAEIAYYAKHHGLTWREDESNQDEAHPRNLVRHQVLPLLARINPQVVATLARTADLLAEEGDRLAVHDAHTLARIMYCQDKERILLHLAELRQLSAGEVRGVLHHALTAIGADMRAIGSRQLSMLAHAVAQTTRRSGPHPLAAGLAWSIVALPGEGLALALHRQHTLPLPLAGPWFDETSGTQDEIPLPLTGAVVLNGWRLECIVIDRAALPEHWRQNPDRWTAYFDADSVTAATLAPAKLAPTRPAPKIDPLGMAGRRKSIGDLFTDARIEPALRHGWPVVLEQESGRVLWVCGLTQSHSTRITDATQNVWVLRWRREVTYHPTTEKEH